jgi:hypothetical protein
MVLGDGDLRGYRVQSRGAERLADQLPPPHAHQAGLEKRLITANWVASEHSMLVAPARPDAGVFSDANLFKSTGALRRIWVLESEPVPGVQTRNLAPPAGAPAGALYTYVVGSGRASYQISWPEGPVLGIVAVPVSAGAHLSAAERSKIATILGLAAQAEFLRIGRVVRGVTATV